MYIDTRIHDLGFRPGAQHLARRSRDPRETRCTSRGIHYFNDSYYYYYYSSYYNYYLHYDYNYHYDYCPRETESRETAGAVPKPGARGSRRSGSEYARSPY